MPFFSSSFIWFGTESTIFFALSIDFVVMIERRGMGSPRQRRAERDGIAPAPQSREGWDRRGTEERRGMGSPRHRKSEKVGLALTPHSGEGWDRPDTVKRRGIVSPRYRKSEKDGLAPTPHSGEGWDRPRKASWDRPGNAELRWMVCFV